MSRIAGILQPGEVKFDRINAALQVVEGRGSSSSIWTQKVASVEGFHIGWTGWKGEPLAQKQNVVLLLEGHIYNDSDLRQKSVSDDGQTYLIDLYHQHGFSKMLSRLNGDFVIVLYDKIKGELFIGRDRFGVKPLYYVIRRDCFFFASRCASLFAMGVAAQPDPAFIGRFAGTHYRYIDNVPGQSPYLGVNQLPAAHYLRVKTGEYFNTKATVELNTWCTLNDEPDFESSEWAEAVLAEKYH